MAGSSRLGREFSLSVRVIVLVAWSCPGEGLASIQLTSPLRNSARVAAVADHGNDCATQGSAALAESALSQAFALPASIARGYQSDSSSANEIIEFGRGARRSKERRQLPAFLEEMSVVSRPESVRSKRPSSCASRYRELAGLADAGVERNARLIEPAPRGAGRMNGYACPDLVTTIRILLLTTVRSVATICPSSLMEGRLRRRS